MKGIGSKRNKEREIEREREAIINIFHYIKNETHKECKILIVPQVCLNSTAQIIECECVCESVSVRVCVYELCVCVCVRERERECVFVCCVYVCVA